MIELDEDALICDLAETYQIFDYKQLPLSQVAVFSCGLKDSSRIKLKMKHQKVPDETLILAGVHDMLSFLVWSKTKNGQKNQNRPPSLVSAFQDIKQPEKESLVFFSGSDFEKARQDIIGGE